MGMLDEVLAQITALPADKREALARETMEATKHLKWIPSPGPQTDAYFCKADVLLYGGEGGGGKSDLLLGLAFNAHQRSLIIRREYSNLSAITDRAVEINGTRDGFNGSSPPRLRIGKQLIEFGACQHAGDERAFQGSPHDLLCVDEAAQLLKQQFQFFTGWVRSTVPGQRTRIVLGSNPPLSAEGEWLIEMFRPWLDITYPKPAKPGELRWFVTDPDGRDLEVSGPEPIQFPGEARPTTPMSRTFIPAKWTDNPFLAKTNYGATLDALPEPYRSAIRDGNFMLGRKDDEWQVIPTAWIRAAQARWTPNPPPGLPMCAIGVDVAMGGEDETILSPRYDGWFAPIIAVPGARTPLGTDVAGLVISKRRDDAAVIIDMGGGYGGGPYEHLKMNGLEPNTDLFAYKGAEASSRRTKDRKLGFTNKRSETIWRFREALDPDQPGGSPIALPDDPMLVADLTAPRFTVAARGIQVESKVDVVKRLGRSPDRGDAVVMCWAYGRTVATLARNWAAENAYGRNPKVITGRERQHELLRR